MKLWSVSALAFLIAAGPAQADAPIIVLHILPNGDVRFAEGPELNLDQFKAELYRMAAMKPVPAFTMDMDDPGLPYAKTIPVTNELKKYNFQVGFDLGQTVISSPNQFKPNP